MITHNSSLLVVVVVVENWRIPPGRSEVYLAVTEYYKTELQNTFVRFQQRPLKQPIAAENI